MPWAFVNDTKAAGGVYGNVKGPDNVTEYGEFLSAMMQELLHTYGSETVNNWQYRVGTETNYGGHWTDTLEKYIAVYDVAQKAIRSVASRAVFGPANWNTGYPPFKAGFLQHFVKVADENSALSLSYYGSSSNDYSDGARAFGQIVDMKDT